MADRYVDDASGGAASPYGSWATAATTLATVDGIDTAGDNIFIAATHTEDIGANLTLAFAGTVAAPTKIFSTAASGAPPTAVSAGAQINTVGTNIANTVTVSGNCYMEGVTLSAGTGTGQGSLVLGQAANNRQVYKNCKFHLNGAGSGARINFGNLNTANVNSFELHDCEMSFAHAWQGITLSNCDVLFKNLTYSALNITSQNLVLTAINASSRGTKAVFEGCDFSNCAADSSLIVNPNAGNGSGSSIIFRNCTLPSSWSGTLCGSAPIGVAPGQRFEMHNCANSDANYKLRIEDYLGTVVDETAIYRDSGASDGTTTGLSWKMTTNADAEYATNVFYSPEFVIWNSTTGTAKTATVEIVYDGATQFKDDQIWLEVQFQGTTGKPRTISLTTEKADPLGSNADVTSSTATWTGDTGTGPNGSATWNQRKLVTASFTPAEIGYVHCRVCMAVASKTIYVDPKITIA